VDAHDDLTATTPTVKRPPQDRIGPLATGVHGRLDWRYAIAADVEGFVIAREAPGVITLRAHVRHADDYKIAQTPLTFVITVRRGEWRWPVLTVLRYVDHAFAARLGEPVAVRRDTDVASVR
jgi:hypothetical protein